MKFSTFLLAIFLTDCLIVTKALTNNFLGLNQPNSNLELFNANPFEFLNTQTDYNYNKPKPSNNNNNNNQNSVPISLKCQICGEVYNNKFDFQIMIEQQNKCQYYENKYSISRDTCTYWSKNIAYKFFDNGGDSYFDRDLAQKIKSCRNFEVNNDNKPNINCQKTKGKVCDILLGNNKEECENLDVFALSGNEAIGSKIEDKKEVALSNFMEISTNLSEVRS